MLTGSIRVSLLVCCFAFIGSGCQSKNKIANSNHGSLFDQMARNDSQKDAVKIRPRLNMNGLKPQSALWKKSVSIEEAASSRKLKKPQEANLAFAALEEQNGHFGKSEKKREHYDNALKSYEKVLQADPNSVDAILGIARMDLLSGRVRDAERGFRKAAVLKPNDANVRASYGQFLVSQNQWTEAISEMRIASNLAPEKQNYRFALAVALVHADRVQEAFPLMASTVGEAEAHYNIGHIYFTKKEYAQADGQFQRALQLKPGLKQASIMMNEIVIITQKNSPRQNEIKQVGFEQTNSTQDPEILLSPAKRTSPQQLLETEDDENFNSENFSEFVGHSKPPRR